MFPLYILLYSLALLYSRALAQQISQRPMPNSWPGLSSGCGTALNTTINCPTFLPMIFLSNLRLQPDELTALCTTQCLNDLNSARSTIQSACSAPTDKIDIDGTLYPASWLVDHYLYTHAVSCRVDPSSSQFCDTLRTSWMALDSLTEAQRCSDCILGGMVTDLNSPFGYDEGYESAFRSSTSSCNKLTYTFTTPGTYSTAASTTVPAVILPTYSCRATYVVTSTDTCFSIAQQYSISSWSLIKLNGLDAKCQTLKKGASLCIDTQCPSYAVQPGDTCASIVASVTGITANQLAAWNPNIDALCLNLHEITSNVICVGPPGGTLPDVQGTTALAPSIPMTPAPAPTNAATNSSIPCGRWYTVKSGDTCSLISVQFSITLGDFYFLNPAINSECTNLWLDSAYCVQAVGTITTYPGYPTTPAGSGITRPYTLTTEVFTTTTWSDVTLPATSYTTPTPKPLAPGTWANCSEYRDIDTKPAIVEQLANSINRNYYDVTNLFCNNTADRSQIDLNSFLRWNPSLTPGNLTGNCVMQQNYRYCTMIGDPLLLPKDDSLCSSIKITDIKPGTPSNCSCFDISRSTSKGIKTCARVLNEFNITLAQFRSWNPWIGTDCDNDLFQGLATNDESQYNAACVRLGNTTLPTNTVSASSTTKTASSTISSASTGPTVAGMINGCTQLYTVQSGDGCASITSQYSITFPQFYEWNPAIGSDCENLWLGYAYCISAPLEFQEGIPAGCSVYHTVVSGDTCYDLAATYGITLAQFYAWNPPVGNDCSGLWLGYAYCVAGGPP